MIFNVLLVLFYFVWLLCSFQHYSKFLCFTNGQFPLQHFPVHKTVTGCEFFINHLNVILLCQLVNVLNVSLKCFKKISNYFLQMFSHY